MSFAYCIVPLSPVRKEPADPSEMVTQLLFGEAVEVLDQKKQWRKIRNLYDDYIGWVDFKQLSNELFSLEVQKPTALIEEPLDFVLTDKNFPMTICMGSELPNLKENQISLGKYNFKLEKEYSEAVSPTRENIVRTSFQFINAPYLWGGKSVLGIDCSGFTQVVYKINGIKIPRDAYQQAELGETLSFIEEAKPGDLAFFDNKDGKIIHVGIMLEDLQIIHAHGKVRIDPLDHSGIFNTDHKKHSHKLRCIKRIV